MEISQCSSNFYILGLVSIDVGVNYFQDDCQVEIYYFNHSFYIYCISCYFEKELSFLLKINFLLSHRCRLIDSYFILNNVISYCRYVVVQVFPKHIFFRVSRMVSCSQIMNSVSSLIIDYTVI